MTLTTFEPSLRPQIRIIHTRTQHSLKPAARHASAQTMGIVLVKGAARTECPFTFIGIIKTEQRTANYTRWIGSRSKVIGEVSDIVYSRIAERYGIKTACEV